MQEANKEFSLAERLQGQYRRLSARYRARSRVEVRLRQPVISFTFDDFPRSALYTGGAILQKYGASGTYYASLGLMGTVAPTGEIFMQQDLPALLRMGHELGCHTWGHCHPWTTPVEDWEVSIRRNQNSLAKIVPGAKMRSMSYPLSVPTAANKKVCERYFDCSRGRGDFLNAGIADRNFLSSHFLERKLGGPEAALHAIEENRRACGWLIFSTHDISANPTDFGWTPEFFETVVRAAIGSGALVLTVIQAWDRIRAAAEYRL